MVARKVNAAAEIVVGTSISTTKGFDRPPVNETKKASWNRSNISVNTAFFSERRLLAGKITVAIMLKATETPKAVAQRSSRRSISRKRVAIIIAPSWPAMASQRKSISVRKRSHLLRAVLLKSFKGASNIMPDYQARLGYPIENSTATLLGVEYLVDCTDL